ncbi:transposase family protein [Streptomyces sp. NPDC055898]
MFTDRLAATLAHLRLGLPHAALAELYGVDRSTVSAAIRETSPLLAARGFAIPGRPGLRIRTLDDLFAYADAEGVDIQLDGTEVQVRRPRAGRPGRKAFASGKKKQNTIKTTTFSDHQGRTLFSGVVRPGRMHDQTAVRTEGIAEQFRLHPDVHAEVDSGYRGLAKEFPSQVSAPPEKPAQDAPDGDMRAWREARRRQSSARPAVIRRSRAGLVELLREKHRSGFQDLVRPPQLGYFLAKLGELGSLVGGQQIGPGPLVGLGLTDPVPQGFLVDPEVSGHMSDRTSRGLDLTDRSLTQFIGVLPWCRHRTCVLPSAEAIMPGFRAATKSGSAQYWLCVEVRNLLLNLGYDRRYGHWPSRLAG